MLQVSVCDGCSPDALSLGEDCVGSTEVDVGRGQVAQALMMHKTPPPEPSDLGGGVRLMVAPLGISAIAIQRAKLGSLKSNLGVPKLQLVIIYRSGTGWP